MIHLLHLLPLPRDEKETERNTHCPVSSAYPLHHLSAVLTTSHWVSPPPSMCSLLFFPLLVFLFLALGPLPPPKQSRLCYEANLTAAPSELIQHSQTSTCPSRHSCLKRDPNGKPNIKRRRAEWGGV